MFRCFLSSHRSRIVESFTSVSSNGGWRVTRLYRPSNMRCRSSRLGVDRPLLQSRRLSEALTGMQNYPSKHLQVDAIEPE